MTETNYLEGYLQLQKTKELIPVGSNWMAYEHPFIRNRLLTVTEIRGTGSSLEVMYYYPHNPEANFTKSIETFMNYVNIKILERIQ